MNYGLCAVMMFQCRFINCKICTTLVKDVGNGGGNAHVGTTGIWEISVPSTKFCFEPKTALKNIVYYFLKAYYVSEHSIKMCLQNPYFLSYKSLEKS